MITPAEQLDRRFEELGPWIPLTTRPSHGWVKAIRQALGMTTSQLAKRLKVAQTRVSELEAAEVHRNITLKTLDRAAEALGCRVVYILVPARPLSETLHDRAHQADSARDLSWPTGTAIVELATEWQCRPLDAWLPVSGDGALL